eukprot:scaffold48_cov311-Pinguiococcus_pyrenoidosus.AAC.242
MGFRALGAAASPYVLRGLLGSRTYGFRSGEDPREVRLSTAESTALFAMLSVSMLLISEPSCLLSAAFLSRCARRRWRNAMRLELAPSARFGALESESESDSSLSSASSTSSAMPCASSRSSPSPSSSTSKSSSSYCVSSSASREERSYRLLSRSTPSADSL